MNKNIGTYCTLFGSIPRNRILEYMLEMGSLNFSIGDIMEELEMSLETVMRHFNKLKREGYLKETCKDKRIQLYSLNKNSKKAQVLIRSFDDCLKLAICHASEHREPVFCEACNNLNKCIDSLYFHEGIALLKTKLSPGFYNTVLEIFSQAIDKEELKCHGG